MKYSQKVKDKAVEGVKKLINQGHDREAVLISIADLTGVPKDLLDSWFSLDEASQRNYLAPAKRVDKLKDYRDKRMNRSRHRHPDDAKLEKRGVSTSFSYPQYIVASLLSGSYDICVGHRPNLYGLLNQSIEEQTAGV